MESVLDRLGLREPPREGQRWEGGGQEGHEGHEEERHEGEE